MKTEQLQQIVDHELARVALADAGELREEFVVFIVEHGGLSHAKRYPEYREMLNELSRLVYGDTYHTAQILYDIRDDIAAMKD